MSQPKAFDDWQAALGERIDHEEACPPCRTYDPATRCPIGRALADAEQEAYRVYFAGRFAPLEERAA